jgi:alpha-galactosidase
MSKAIKLGIIGAGSATFSLGLVRDLCLCRNLWGSTVSFMDIDAERLDVIHLLATRYAAELGADLKFEKTLDRRAAMQGADFVINTAAWRHGDEEEVRALGEKHGYYRGVRLGNFYNLNLMLGVARDMSEVCPSAYLIQSSNPVYDGCTLMTRETGIKAIGLCHGHFGYRDIARVLGLEEEHVTAQMPGLNHIIYMTHFEYKGENAYPLIDEWIETKAEEYWATYKPTFSDNQMSRAAIDQYRLLGLMPIGDTPRQGGWQYHLDLEAKKHWYGHLGGFDSEIGWQIYLDRLSERVDHIFKVAVDRSVSLTKEFPPTPTHEQQVPIIDALVNGTPPPKDICPQGLFQVNVPNNGAIEGIADDVVVEVPAVVSKRGVQPVHVGKMPQKLMLHVLLPRILEMERNLWALKSGDRKMLESMLLWDPRTRTPEQAAAVLEDMLALPFNREMAEHYR